jgi:hypothetical protein
MHKNILVELSRGVEYPDEFIGIMSGGSFVRDFYFRDKIEWFCQEGSTIRSEICGGVVQEYGQKVVHFGFKMMIVGNCWSVLSGASD